DMPSYLRSDLRIVDLLLVDPAEQIRSADQLEATTKALELRVLAKGRQVQLIAAGDHHAVDLHVLRAQRHFAGFRGNLQVLEGVERALEQIGKLQHAAGRVDQLTKRLEQRDRR